jgi:hypothetical protein
MSASEYEAEAPLVDTDGPWGYEAEVTGDQVGELLNGEPPTAEEWHAITGEDPEEYNPENWGPGYGGGTVRVSVAIRPPEYTRKEYTEPVPEVQVHVDADSEVGGEIAFLKAFPGDPTYDRITSALEGV